MALECAVQLFVHNWKIHSDNLSKHTTNGILFGDFSFHSHSCLNAIVSNNSMINSSKSMFAIRKYTFYGSNHTHTHTSINWNNPNGPQHKLFNMLCMGIFRRKCKVERIVTANNPSQGAAMIWCTTCTSSVKCEQIGGNFCIYSSHIFFGLHFGVCWNLSRCFASACKTMIIVILMANALWNKCQSGREWEWAGAWNGMIRQSTEKTTTQNYRSHHTHTHTHLCMRDMRDAKSKTFHRIYYKRCSISLRIWTRMINLFVAIFVCRSNWVDAVYASESEWVYKNGEHNMLSWMEVNRKFFFLPFANIKQRYALKHIEPFSKRSVCIS